MSGLSLGCGGLTPLFRIADQSAEKSALQIFPSLKHAYITLNSMS